ncbi:hypothetical protein, variant [Sphaeroforma arctica JP610]|uniref:Uncharacterized protein n=1 Tax=Sphaeroforma arctica JP610 TaxID=667725 RepID=A0A0L0FRW5_9EUKA|nr:hypothetical protein, variant [Sphaeroforma arctica JP610]KNC78708.1 hypothetical protein, variant [Sphaeroforma arctica JP610]|eukprot:XP_014152610.1 hypothetical protein, variant [Sphaeroforma arctica JP610]
MFVIVCSRSGNPETQYKRKIKRRQEKRDAKKQFRTRVTSTLVCNCAYRVRLAHCEPPEGETGVPFQRGVEYHGWIQITMTCFSHNHECEPNPKPVRTVKVPTRRVLGCTENGANNISPLKKLAISDMRSTNPLGWESHGSINGIAAVDPIQSAIQSHPTSLNRVPEPEPHAHQIAVEQYQRIAHQITAPLEGGILYVEGKRFRVRPTPVTVAEGDSGIRVLQYALSSRGHDYTKQQIRDILSNCQNPTWLECTQTFVFNFNIDQWRQGMKGHAPLDDMGMLSAIFEFGLNMVLYSCRKNSLFCDLRVLSTALDQRLMSVAPESLLTSDKSTLPYHDLPVFYEPGLAFHVVDRDIDSTLAPEECWRVPSRKQVSLW